MKKFFSSAILWLAVALGTIAFLAWKLITTKRNLDEARLAIESGHPAMDKIKKDLDIVTTDTEEQIIQVKNALEAQTREDLIYAFKKAFHVARPDDTDDSPDSEPDTEA